MVNENKSSPIQAPTGRKEKILNNMVSRLQKIAAKSRLIAKAAEKVSSYPLILSVEVKRLDGYLVVNMAPPPSDAFWLVQTHIICTCLRLCLCGFIILLLLYIYI